MKKLKAQTKIIGAASALVIAVALSAGTTFAWFTSSNTVSVNAIEASVKTAGGDLAVSVGSTESGTYKTSLTSDDFTSYTGSFTFDPVSAKVTNSTTSSALTFYVEDSTNKGTVSTTTTESGYLAIPLTFRTTSACKIYLDTESAVSLASNSSSTSVVWTGDTDSSTYGLTVTKDSEIEASAANAARVGFVSYTGAGTSTAASAYVWSPNEKCYNGYEYTNQSTGVRSSTPSGYYKNNLARDYYNLVNGLSGENALSSTNAAQCYYGENATDITASVCELGSTDTTARVLTTTTAGSTNTQYYYSTVTVYIWIEGTDGDCFNSISGQTIDVVLNFIAVENTQTNEDAGTESDSN